MAKIDPNAWMMTFSDLLNLLITFFVLLIAMSSMDNKKLKQVSGFFQGAVGVLEKTSSGVIKPGPASSSHSGMGGRPAVDTNIPATGPLGGSKVRSAAPDEKGDSNIPSKKHMALRGSATRLFKGQPYGWQDFARKVLEVIHDPDMNPYLRIKERPDGYEISLDKVDPFLPGSSRMNPRAVRYLLRVASLARICNCEVHIEGGFKDGEDYMNEDHPTIFHLGAKRAAVLAEFMQREGVPGMRLYPETVVYSRNRQVTFYFRTRRRTLGR